MPCPHARLEPLDPGYLADPYARYASLREQQPVFYDDELDMYVVTRHADVTAVFRDPERFCATNAQDPAFPLHPEAAALLADAGFRKLKTMSNNDGDDHTRIRQHTQVGFSPRRLRALEPVVRAGAAALVSSMAAGGAPADLVAALSFPLPAGVIFTLLGFPEDDTEMLKEWCGDRMSFSWGRPDAAQQVAIAHDMLRYWAYCEAHVQRRLDEPADDFTSDLLAIHRADPASLSTAEIAHVIYGLSFAGHETTTNLITNTVRRVLEADVWDRVRDDAAARTKAVDEGVRHDSSVITWRRQATADSVLAGTEIPAGAKLLLLLGSANHDPSVFDAPDAFSLDRDGPPRALSFGFGKHYCLGATLAKVEVQVVLELLAAAFPALQLVAGQQLGFHPNITFRGPRRLLVAW